MTAVLNHRTVLDAIPAGGATEEQIAATLGVPGYNRALDRIAYGGQELHDLLYRLVCGDLASMRTTGEGWQYVPTARSRRMADATDEELSAWVSGRLSSASALTGGGAR